ncbi:MAG: DDE-type integrase/transposase/recombinase, partial [Deltaproteobacteria bacterium]|nr:DDE-type integrase/transposase/recombinase [Deltaproteobacteria bacterium]
MNKNKKKKRPKFYKSLCQKIPNALLSLDGSDFTIWIANVPYTSNLELAVDVSSFTHTAFSIADTETSREVIRVLEAHIRKWGTPLGILCDHDSANLSEDPKRYINMHGIELVASGPYNPKGNGTDEGAFSQMKKALGVIRLDMSSPKALAKSVLNTVVSVYIYMRNRLCVYGANTAPIEQMASEVTRDQRDTERQRLKEYKKKKQSSNEDQPKLDRLNWVIDHYGLTVAPEVLKRAQYSIKFYDLQAIAETESAFLKATNRDADRCDLSYFFGILKNIQQQRDDDAIREY